MHDVTERGTRPDGVVTFLLADVEGSTDLWVDEAQDAARRAIERTYELLDQAIGAHDGFRPTEQGEGDSVVAVFRSPRAAVAAAITAQRSVLAEPWPTARPVRIRMAVHTGEAIVRDDHDYLGPAIIRAARLRSLGSGGQVLVSGVTATLLAGELPFGSGLIDLGEHPLKGFRDTERVFQLTHADLPCEFPSLAHRQLLRGDAPLELTTLVGRDDEVRTLSRMLSSARLVTLCGSGGSGKTRLALRVAETVAADRPAWFVDLAPLPPDGDVDAATARSLGLVMGTAGPRAAVLACLERERGLLVFDNGEHVLDPLADLVVELLTVCPDLTVLVTSCAVLDVRGEFTWQIPPLSLPDANETDPQALLEQSEAVQLFVERAAAAGSGFRLDSSVAHVVAEVVRRLDGMPLGIELAAARTRTLTPRRILDGLDDALGFLDAASARRGPRQRTLEASIAWSHDLLDERERIALRRLSVFASAAALDAVEDVLTGPGLQRADVLPAVERLVEQSLVGPVDQGDGVSRFRLLEVVRQYARRRLEESGEADDIDRADALHMLDRLVEQAEEIEHDPATAATAAASIEDLGMALSWAERLDPRRFAEAVFAARGLWLNAPVPLADSIAMVDRGVAVADGAGDTVLLGRLLACRSHLSIFALSTDMRSYATRALATTDDPWTVRRASYTDAYVLIGMGREHEALERAAASLRCADPNVDPIGYDHAAFLASTLAYRHGLDISGVELEWVDVPATKPLRSAALACRLLSVGDLRGAVPLMDGAAASARAGRQRTSLRAVLDQIQTQIRLFAGLPIDIAGLRHDLDHARRMGERLAERALATALAHATAVLGSEHWEDAIVMLEQSGSEAEFVRSSTRSAVASAIHLGQGEIARARYRSEQLTVTALRVGTPLLRARALVVDGQVCQAAGDIAGATSRATDVLRIGRSVPFERIHALELLASCADDAGETERAAFFRSVALAERWRTGYRYRVCHPPADPIEPDPEAPSVDQAVELASRGRAPKRSTPFGWESLTPTERRVAALVASGMTNAQVGRELLMGAATVKTHLSRSFAKLGVINRAALAALVSRHAPESERGRIEGTSS